VGNKLKTKQYEKYYKKNDENDSGAPWRMKRESNLLINAVNMCLKRNATNYTQADMHKNWAKLTLTAT